MSSESDIIRTMMEEGSSGGAPVTIDGIPMWDYVDRARGVSTSKTKEKGMSDSPLQIMLGGDREAKTMRALSNGLRRKKEIGYLAQLSGDPGFTSFGKGLGAEVEQRTQQRLTDREKQQQRDMTQGYYDQIGERSALAHTLDQRKQAEVERHNLELERRYGVMTRKDVTRGVQKLSASLQKGGTPELQEAMSQVRTELDKYKKPGADIPGYGAGRFRPNFLSGAASKALNLKVQAVTNILLKARSGGAVTPQEAERLAGELGATFGLSDQDFLLAWRDLEDTVDAGMANIMAQAGPEVEAQYYANMERQGIRGGKSRGTDTEVEYGALGGDEESPPPVSGDSNDGSWENMP